MAKATNTRRRPRSLTIRITSAAAGVLLMAFATWFFQLGVQEGWDDGSFALVGYFGAACFATGAVLCLRVAFSRRG